MSDHNPGPGYLRRITIDKSAGPLGITIQCNEGGGIFVSTVTTNSIASRAGLRCGDQLLEVCGINMRDANQEIAAKVLRQCGNTMTMLAQYCPDSEYLALVFTFKRHLFTIFVCIELVIQKKFCFSNRKNFIAYISKISCIH